MLKKKWFIAIPLVLLVVLAFTGCAVRVEAKDAADMPQQGVMQIEGENAQTRGGASGSCGDNLTWVLDEEGTLTISGVGMMDDYEGVVAPWTRFEVPVRRVVVKQGVVGLGNFAFADCDQLTEFVFEGNAPVFADNAFAGVKAEISYAADNDTWVADVMQNYGGDISWVENSN